jgi:hypothetical protein
MKTCTSQAASACTVDDGHRSAGKTIDASCSRAAVHAPVHAAYRAKEQAVHAPLQGHAAMHMHMHMHVRVSMCAY